MAELAIKSNDVRFINTICSPTRKNQSEIKELAKTCDVLIIVGSASSANSKRLETVARSLNPKSWRVASPDELKAEWFVKARRVGVSAGASSPDNLIQAVIAALENFEIAEEVDADVRL